MDSKLFENGRELAANSTGSEKNKGCIRPVTIPYICDWSKKVFLKKFRNQH